MNNLIAPVKGTRDFYPEDMAFQSWFYQKVKEVSESFGFQEYEGPSIESLDLYAAKSGEELVKKQAFTLEDKSGKILALRPEMTPTLARMVAQKSESLTFPVKWYTYGRRFRYETPQKGRGREFFQWDIDILGPENFEADAEIISIASVLYQRLGLTPNEVKIKINDRKFLQNQLSTIGISEDKTLEIFKIIDKKAKVTERDFVEMLREKKLEQNQISSLLDILNNKNAFKSSPWLTGIIELVEKMGLAEFVDFDPTIVRGLDYYTRTVFEGWDVKGEFRSIWGGGRYDNLTAEVGGREKIPGVGFAMGDMVILEVLKANNKYPDLKANKTKILVTVFSPDLLEKSAQTANNLRKNNINTELYLDPLSKLEKQLKYADKKGIPFVVIIGPDEAAKNTVQLKNLGTKEQKEVKTEEILNLTLSAT